RTGRAGGHGGPVRPGVGARPPGPLRERSGLGEAKESGSEAMRTEPQPTPAGSAGPGTRKGRGMLYVIIMISVVLAAVAQLTLKHGMNQVTAHGGSLDLGAPTTSVRRVATNASVVLGLLIFVLSAAAWLVVL